MNKRIIFLAGFFFLGFIVSAFGQIQRAKKLMELYDYTKAINVLKHEVSKNPNNINNEAYLLLGKCYQKKNDVLSAKGWYEKAIEKGNSDPINYYWYAQFLRSLGEYQQAKVMFLKYASLDASDKRGIIYAGYCDSAVAWKNKPVLFDIRNSIALNTKYGDFGTTFFHDGIIFTSDRINKVKERLSYDWTGNQYLKLYYADPTYPNDYYDGFNQPKLEKRPFNLSYHDGPACFAQGDSLVYITRTNMARIKNEKGNKHIKTHLLKLFYSHYNGERWESFKPFFLNSDKYSVGHPTLTPDGKTLYFISDMPGGYGGTDIYMCKWENNKWGNPINLGPKINSFGNEMFPTITNTGELFFSSDGWPGYGGLDIFVTSKVNGEWTTPLNLHHPINSSYDDFSMIVKKDKTSGLFSSNRMEGKGNDDIYGFKLKPNTENLLVQKTLPEIVKIKDSVAKIKANPLFYVSGYVKDKITHKPIPNASVFLLDENKGEVLVLKTDSAGFFSTPVKKDNPYVVKGMQTSYIADCEPFSFDTINKKTELSIPRDLLLDKLDVNKVFKVENIYYDFDKWNIRADAKPELDKLVRIMKENPINIELRSHTDCRGSFAYNDGLSQRRAESAVSYIISEGISTGRLFARGYGKRQLINRCSDGVQCTEAEHQENRRTEFKILSSFEDRNNEIFDFNKYKEKLIYDLRLFPVYFFDNCSTIPLKVEPGQESKNEDTFSPTPVKSETKTTHFITLKLQSNPNEKKAVAVTSKPVNIESNPTTTVAGKSQSLSFDNGYKFSGYKVQIDASITPMEIDKVMKKHNLKEQITEDHLKKWYCYCVGEFQDFKVANDYKNTLISKNKIMKAFVVKYVDGVRAVAVSK